MTTHDESGVPTGMPAILFAIALGAPSAFFVGFAGGIGAGLGGTSSALTLPTMAILGACLGAGTGGLIALLCRCHLRRGFCCLFGAVLGAVGIVGFGVLHPDKPNDPHQLFKDATFLGVIILGVLGGAAVQRFVTRFGAKSRVWAGIGAGVFSPLGVALQYFAGEQLGLAHHPEYVVFLLFGALIAALVGGWIGALAGAIRDSA